MEDSCFSSDRTASPSISRRRQNRFIVVGAAVVVIVASLPCIYASTYLQKGYARVQHHRHARWKTCVIIFLYNKSPADIVQRNCLPAFCLRTTTTTTTWLTQNVYFRANDRLGSIEQREEEGNLNKSHNKGNCFAVS